MGNWGTSAIAGGLCLGLIVGGCETVSTSEGGPESASLVVNAPPAEGSPASRDALKLARDVEARGSMATALPLYERAAAEAGASAEAQIALADAYVKVNQDADAVGAYRRALAKYPDNLGAQFGLGSALLRTGQTRDGLRVLEKVAPQLNSAQGYDRLGVANMMAGQPKEALAAFEQALRMSGRDPDVSTNAALAAALMGDKGRAVSLAEQTLRYPGVKDYHRRNLILVFGISGKPEAASGAAGGQVSTAEVSELISRAGTIRALATPKQRALALGTVRGADG